MHKLGFPNMKSFDKFKSLSGGTTNTKTFSLPSTSDSHFSLGSFANLKLTAEKLVKEQASVKTDLEMANTKLKKSIEHIRVLEEKLQNAFNENAKLKVKQKEDEKLWKGLESKFSSTKALSDQLTETLQHLAVQVQNSEESKEFFENKLSETSITLDSLNQQMLALSLKLEASEKIIQMRDNELEELKIRKDESDKFYSDEQRRAARLLEEKDAVIKKIEATLEADKLTLESLTAKLGALHLELEGKDDEIIRLMDIKEKLEKQNNDLQLSNDDYVDKLVSSTEKIKNLDNFVQQLAAALLELDKQSLTFSQKFDLLNSLYESCYKLVHKKMDLFSQHAQRRYEQLNGELLCVTSKKDALLSVNQELNSKIAELEKIHESEISQLSGECHLAGESIQKLKVEMQTLLLKKNEAEGLVTKLEGKIQNLSASAESSEMKMKELLTKISELETKSKENNENLHAEIQKKDGEILALQKEIEKCQQHEDIVTEKVDQLQNVIKEKEQIILSCGEREKKLEDQLAENQGKLAATETKLAESRKQYDNMLESKQMELSRHLKELSQKNDQAINEIRRKYDVEKQEIVNQEKEKADKVIEEMARKCDAKLAECKDESGQYLLKIQEEHAALVAQIKEESEKREISLKARHDEDLKRAQLQAENELRERITHLRNDYEAQIKAIKCEHEDECRKLEEELVLQKSKEDRQRALLQLQWKVMSDKPQEDQEVNSRKDYSISSRKMYSGGDRHSHHVRRAEDYGQIQNSPPADASQTPVSKLLKKVENANTNTGSVLSIPKHSKKVTHREYEVETANGRTITKRRKTKSTVMFEDPRKHGKMASPRIRTPMSVKDPSKHKRMTSPRITASKGVKGIQEGIHPPASNIGDLFTEGSLNPYADDPYAFD